MRNEDKYLFDLNGFIILKDLISKEKISKIKNLLKNIEQSDVKDYPPNIIQSKPRTDKELYLSNIVESDIVLHDLIDIKPIIDIIKFVSLGNYRLNHTYSISHWKDSRTYLHMGGSPLHPKATYTSKNSEIFSLLTKVVFPISNHNIEDGCFAVVPGSHKSNFPSPFGIEPDDNPALVGIDAQPGDALIFTEALTHGSLFNISGKCRRTVFFCYSVGYMPDWTKLGLRHSDHFIDSLDEQKKEIIRLKID